MIADRWGVTDAEVARRYPCDELVTKPISFDHLRELVEPLTAERALSAN